MSQEIMPELDLLHRLARLYGVQTAHWDIFGRLAQPPIEAIIRVLGMLGAAAERMADVKDALRQRREMLWRRVIDPVVVAWNGGPLQVKLRLPASLAEATVNYQVVLETGGRLTGRSSDSAGIGAVERCIEGQRFVARWLTFPEKLPFGYHHLQLQIGKMDLPACIFSSPLQAYADPEVKAWGVFCPLYALHSEKSWGVGDFSDLESAAGFVAALGAGAVSTLPLLAIFLDEPFNPSPYAPVSRLFWNELYIDVAQIPELRRCPAARSLVRSANFQTELQHLRTLPLVEYRRTMALKRRVLEELLGCLLKRPSARRASFERFVAAHPLAQDYAAFRAKTERERKPWEKWPQAASEGTLKAGDYNEEHKRYHLYAQWLADEQMSALSDRAQAARPALYLDFPLGVNRDGFDVWRERELFALDASGGAPPDGFFIRGQNWGFPPLRPDVMRKQGYGYFIDCVRHHLRHARLLRIDHVMGLHRLYWIPQGFAATEGVYVRYPDKELYAILSLESHKHQAQIVGENLGTVPPRVNAALARHRLHGMYVGQFGVTPNPQSALDPVPAGVVASLNTHDTPTFAGFWSGRDIDDRCELGLLSAEQACAEHEGRALQRDALTAYLRSRGWLVGEKDDGAGVLLAWLSYLAESDADFLLVNVEDLWLEPSPQNVPGTWNERPNWQRKAHVSLEELKRMPQVVESLRAIDDLRKRRRQKN